MAVVRGMGVKYSIPANVGSIKVAEPKRSSIITTTVAAVLLFVLFKKSSYKFFKGRH